MHPDVSIFIQSLNKAGITAAAENASFTNNVRCYYRNNPDGTIRWVWPASANQADFLRFYHRSGFRPALFCFLAKILAGSSMLRILSHGNFIVYLDKRSFADFTHNKLLKWAWFAGTVGPNRKSILWHNQDSVTNSSFIKIPLSRRAEENLDTEVRYLTALDSLKFKNIVLPACSFLGDWCRQLSDIGKHTRRTNRFSELPRAAIMEWLTTELKRRGYNQSNFARKLDGMFEQLGSIKDERIPSNIIENLLLLKNSSATGEELETTIAHGDFTPWNVMSKGDQLHLIDWELAGDEMPVLFDLFHFVYQSNILVGNKGYRAIRDELDNLFAEPEWHSFIKQHKINTTFCERLYLEYIMAYYINVYHQQPEWHKQITWLLTTWNDALNWYLYKGSFESPRRLVLKDLGVLLQRKSYAVLKWMYEDLETLPETSDIDICMSRADANKLLKELKGNLLIGGIIISRRSFMTHAAIVLKDGNMLHLDLIHDFRRKSIVFMDGARLLNRSVINKYGISIPAPEDDFVYTWLFYWLNHSDIPERYDLFFKSFDKQAHARLLSSIRGEYDLPVLDYENVISLDKSLNEKLLKNLSLRGENRGIVRLAHLCEYYIDSIKNIMTQKGFIITFSGVDGAGKSTVIENIRKLVDKKLRKKVIVLRHRPGLLPILSAWKHGKKKAESMAANTLPRQGKNSNSLSSLLRFSYYYLDYLLGQWYVQLRYVRLGYVVIYDRYYFDFINDSRRSNIDLSPSLTKWLYRFLLKPRLNFFLYADADVILQRKQELDGPTISRLTQKYLSLFNLLKKRSRKASYIPVENNELSDTLGLIYIRIKNLHQ